MKLFVELEFTALGCTNGEALLPSPLTGKMFVLVGAGGAGRALAFGAKSRGAQVFIFDIDFGIYLELFCSEKSNLLICPDIF